MRQISYVTSSTKFGSTSFYCIGHNNSSVCWASGRVEDERGGPFDVLGQPPEKIPTPGPLAFYVARQMDFCKDQDLDRTIVETVRSQRYTSSRIQSEPEMNGFLFVSTIRKLNTF